VVLVYRDGKLVDKREYHWEGLDGPADSALLGAFLAQYYEANPAVPERVETPFPPEDAAALREFLVQRRGASVRLLAPRRGARARVLSLAQDNAREAFRLRFRHPREAAGKVGHALAAALGLPGEIRRIECFDISHTGGEAQVASLVVWEAGALKRSEYRSFNVRAGAGPDDPAAMAEAVGRRYRRRLAEAGRLPDLVLVDGGPTQLAAALAALGATGAELPVAALAKRMEEIHVPGGRPPLHLEPNDPARLLLQRLRDEAHRVAITRHRRRRRARRMATQLLAIPGIGPKRAQSLLERFGSVDGVRAAAPGDVAAVVGTAAAARVVAALRGRENRAGLDENSDSR
jgi:excinuclease ABC subunit C